MSGCSRTFSTWHAENARRTKSVRRMSVITISLSPLVMLLNKPAPIAPDIKTQNAISRWKFDMLGPRLAAVGMLASKTYFVQTAVHTC